MSQGRISRRELAVGATLLAGVAAGRARAEGLEKMTWDVVIIGAGFAGLIAARELRNAGHSVIVVEARDRIGGRTHSERQGDHVVEYGGTWVHWTQPYIWMEILRYGAELIETPSATPQRIVLAHPDGPRDVPLHEAGAALSSSLNKVLREAEKVYPRPFEPAFAADEVRLRSHISLADRVAGAEGFERSPRRIDRLVDISRGAKRHIVERLFSRRVDDGDCLGGHGINPGAVDVEFKPIDHDYFLLLRLRIDL